MEKNFKILEVNPTENTMVIDWLDGNLLNHAIPSLLLGDMAESFTAEQRVAIIEEMRPPAPVIKDIPQGLLDLVDGPEEVIPDPEEV